MRLTFANFPGIFSPLYERQAFTYSHKCYGICEALLERASKLIRRLVCLFSFEMGYQKFSLKFY